MLMSEWKDVLKKKPFKGYSKKTNSVKGGLSAKGRAYFKRKEGANLKPPVTSKNPSPAEKKRRKSFCSRSQGWAKKVNGRRRYSERARAARKRWKC